MAFELIPLRGSHIGQFKKDMQAAFRPGAVNAFGETDEEILPESHIDRSLNTEGAAAFEAVVDGESVSFICNLTVPLSFWDLGIRSLRKARVRTVFETGYYVCVYRKNRFSKVE